MVLQRHGDRGQAVLSEGLRFVLSDVAYLASDTGAAALGEADALALTDRLADITALRVRHGDRAPVLVETTLLRRKAAAKLPGTHNWLFTGEALQQATAGPVAAHRASRLAGLAVHDVTCSIGTELASLQRTASVVIGSDVDPVRLAMARHNLGLDSVGGGGVLLCRADALAPVTRDAVVFADPARRSAGRRRFDPRDYLPGLDRLLDAYRDRRLVVKCSPGMDFDAVRAMGFEGEVEVTSWAGSVREACLWPRELSEPGVTRRAVVLDRDERITDAHPDECVAAPVGRWIVDPDGAVVRAGLVRQYAVRHGLWQVDPEIAYLSGDELPPGVRGFEVLDEVSYGEKRLREALGMRDCGALEILVRGVAVDPDALRRRLRLRGATTLSVVIMRVGSGSASRPMAYICRPSR